MKKVQPKVYIVDDDPAMRDALSFMFKEAGLAAEAYATGEEFLEAAGGAEGCVILDLRMPGMDGSEVHRRLRAGGSTMPVIFLTGHGEVASAVREMRGGAYDYLTKPASREELLECVKSALALAGARRESMREVAKAREMLGKLTQREREVLREVEAGHSSKEIARKLGVSVRTIANHRAHFMKKMKAANTADLVRKLSQLGAIAGVGARW